jgi:UPF0755 protein
MLVRAFVVLAIFWISYIYAFSSPRAFPEGIIVTVPEGQSVREIAYSLKENKVIRSTTVFELLIRATGGTNIAGEYSFQRRENVFTVGKRIARGDFRITPIRVKIVEGATVQQIGDLLAEKLPNFDKAQFVQLAQAKEGYLFPDTYFILPGATPETVLNTFLDAFTAQLEAPDIKAAISRSGKSLGDIVTMASLLEREAPDSADRRIISGILWKRIRNDMYLQVDAVFPYIIGKNSFELTKKDLTTDSPYNTYVHKGLPAGPIANPGLDAIMAAVTPIDTQYWYYLSDMHGVMHYSATYEQHLAAKKKYLDS